MTLPETKMDGPISISINPTLNDVEKFAEFLREKDRNSTTMRYFDWDRFARIVVERGIVGAAVGLNGDWMSTAQMILMDGKPLLKRSPFTASTWAVPGFMADNGRFEPCYLECHVDQFNTDGFWECRKWPRSAIKILKMRKTIDHQATISITHQVTTNLPQRPLR